MKDFFYGACPFFLLCFLLQATGLMIVFKAGR
jgi:hypothetical protein